MDYADKREVIIKDSYDVIVVGGGIGGVAAAVSASRNGAKTLLIEKQINLGGLATVGLINWYEPLCDGNGNQVIYGIAEELIKLSIKYGYENLPKKWGGEGKNAIHYSRYATAYSPTIFSLALDEYLTINGADIRFDTLATYPVIENGHCSGIIAESVSGKEFFPCKCVIDATGDASVCFSAGLPLVTGKNYHIYIAHAYSKKDLKEYEEKGDTNKFRSKLVKGSDLYGNGQPKKLSVMNEYNSDSENEFIKWGKGEIFNIIKNRQKDETDIMKLPTMPQYRKIRRLVGATVFDAKKKEYDDSIGKCGDFRKPGDVYELPYSMLYNESVDNLLVAGRIVSADGDGWEITRVIPVCAITGEAAGKAAAMISRNNIPVNKVDTKFLSR